MFCIYIYSNFRVIIFHYIIIQFIGKIFNFNLQKGRQPSYYFLNKFDVQKLLEENQLQM